VLTSLRSGAVCCARPTELTLPGRCTRRLSARVRQRGLGPPYVVEERGGTPAVLAWSTMDVPISLWLSVWRSSGFLRQINYCTGSLYW
jgi:hypothetical protein